MMPPKKKAKKIKVPKSRRYKRIRTFALINVLLLVFNIFSYFWISGPGVFKTQASETGLCLKICPQGQSNCGDLSAAACQNLISPPDQEAEEDEGQQVQVQETTTTAGGGLSVSPLTTPLGLVSAGEIKNSLVPAEAARPIYNRIEAIAVSVPGMAPITVTAGQRPVIPAAAGGGAGAVSLVFQGKTNIKNAIVIITLNSPQTFYATTRADADGKWQWTPPESLAPGLHHLTVLAMSPSNAQIRQVYDLEFYVEAPLVAAPEPPPKAIAPRFPEILPPVKLPPIEVTKDIYALYLKVAPAENFIYPGGQLNLAADIVSFDPAVKKAVNLEFAIINQAGEVIFAEADVLEFKDSFSVIKRLGLKKDIAPGNYIATVQLTQKGIAYLASAGFVIQKEEEKPLLVLPGRIIISRETGQKGLFISFVFLSLLLILFLIILWREYQKAKSEIQIADKDLWQSGQII